MDKRPVLVSRLQNQRSSSSVSEKKIDTLLGPQQGCPVVQHMEQTESSLILPFGSEADRDEARGRLNQADKNIINKCLSQLGRFQ